MKRLKTISLFLLVCIGLSVQTVQAQSSSCANVTNLSVDWNCEFTISPQTLHATGPAATAGSISFNVGTGTLSEFMGGYVTQSLFDLGLPRGGVVEYALYGSTDGTGPMLCWGEINLEVKFIPEPETSYREMMCGQYYEFEPPLHEVVASLESICSAEITDIVQSKETQGEPCDDVLTIRTIRGQVDIDGTKLTRIFRIDTIAETPLDTGMIVCPIGGPTKLDAIVLQCEDIGDTYPSPEVVEEYAVEGIRAAYPYVDKGPDTTIMMVDSVIKIIDSFKVKILIIDDLGDEYWAYADSIVMRDSAVIRPDTVISHLTIPLKNTPICNLGVKYVDQEFPGCAGPDSKIMRTWSILDWCNGSTKECVQWIVVETEGPKITPVPDGFPAIAPWLCTAQYPLSAEVDQGCSESIQIVFSSSLGTIENNNLLVGLDPFIPVEVTVTAIDDCGQRATETFVVTPMDSLPPVAIANDQINVSLSGDPLVYEPDADRGTAKVYVDAIDAGSHNSGCGDVNKCLLLKEELEDPVIIGSRHIEVDGQPIYYSHGCVYDGIYPGVPGDKNNPGRDDIPYVICKEFVKFCCASVGDNNVAMVVTNGSDREARTWTIVTVEDKSSAIVRCPDPITVGCEEDFEIPRPIVFEGICINEPVEYTVVEERDNCGNGRNIYTWTRGGDFICTTEVFFDSRSGFNPYEIKWPKHYNGVNYEDGIRRECIGNIMVETPETVGMGDPFICSEGESSGEPVWCSSSCGLIGVNFEDQVLESIDACKKILREWTVIDWCTWDPNTGIDDENDSFDEFTAVNDTWLGEGDWLTDSRNSNGSICKECDKPGGEADYIYFRYDTVDVDGYYTFDQIIKIIDNDKPIVTAPDTVSLSIFGGATSKGDNFDECFASDVLNASVEDFCGETSIDVSRASWLIQVFELVDGVPILITSKQTTGPSATMNTQEGMSGSVHLITWTVRDGCGNNGSASTYVLFVEDKKPTPLCIQNLSTSTMSTDGSVTIWATDYDAGSFDNCSEVDMMFKDDDGNFTASKRFVCTDIQDGISEIFDIELYAIDALGNYDFCNVSLRVDDFNDNCDDTGEGASNLISGQVSTAFGDMVEDVMVSLNVGMQDMTTAHGKYAFNDLQYASFEIKATKDNDYLNGVTALDALLIQRHMLAISLLDSPYKMIAADINNDGRVSALDLVDLRKLILGVFDELPNNSSWRFVAAHSNLEDAPSPFPFTEVISIENFDGYERAQNFIGVKIGDINENVIANSLKSGDSRSSGKLEFTLENRTLSAGEIIEVPFSAKQFENINAYQFTLEMNGLAFIDVSAGDIDVSMQNFGIINENTITTSWFAETDGQSFDELFVLRFEVLEDTDLSQALSISSNVTKAIGYTSDGSPLTIDLAFNTSSDRSLTLYQNTPNPFSEKTTIGFDIPVNGMATLEIFDVTGKMITRKSDSFSAGYNEFTVEKESLLRSGVMYYQIEFSGGLEGSSEFTSIKKMIQID